MADEVEANSKHIGRKPALSSEKPADPESSPPQLHVVSTLADMTRRTPSRYELEAGKDDMRLSEPQHPRSMSRCPSPMFLYSRERQADKDEMRLGEPQHRMSISRSSSPVFLYSRERPPEEVCVGASTPAYTGSRADRLKHTAGRPASTLEVISGNSRGSSVGQASNARSGIQGPELMEDSSEDELAL